MKICELCEEREGTEKVKFSREGSVYNKTVYLCSDCFISILPEETQDSLLGLYEDPYDWLFKSMDGAS